MNQEKIGVFIKELRKEKQLTQEDFAQIMNVSNRSVSRWETGRNLPDLDILIEIADYFKVELREILDGERKSEQMKNELEDTVLKVADYSNEEKNIFTRLLHFLFVLDSVFVFIYLVFEFLDVPSHPIVDFTKGFTLGSSFGTLVIGVIFTSKHLKKIRAFKLRLLEKI